MTMLRFVILDHDHPFQHWDFLLEDADVLRAWRLRAEPKRGAAIRAEPLPGHRKVYLDYEGPVSGDRGRVVRWDAGTFDWDVDANDELRVRLAGARVAGPVIMRRSADGRWSWEWT
jgi:hypothetical protein